ncbi:putative disease resistance RPP13-like protein 1 isoform X2 [Malus sylvestris]|uniref:putative disease resistance RPP13-like protein 1 isoform X2 n=1 Tax=Malus sylvestris TaxID=3752 RepID=UPI0021AC6878|nr:putative disease resistance RPP13-like protein 1 isoform X2 [Malus sylvestris]XP_050140005.1 putative disease resistance RPP13-like protein 1 isoform X2 [Malus sylvestris]
MALVGEALLSGSIQVLCEKIASGEFMAFFRARRLNHSLMDKLKVTLITLHAVLNDAEEKQIVNLAVGMWLDELKHAVFEAEDLVDEIDTEALRHEVKDQTKQTQVCNFLSTSRNPFNYEGMNGRIEELFQRLEHLAEQRNRLGLREGIGRMVSQRTPTTSVVEEGFCPYGRDKDKEKLKKLLLLSDNESSSNFSVVPIVGMGGVGKTTLAQLLYNDEQVKEHFDVHAWLCVTEQYDALRVLKTLIEQITEKSCDISDMNSLEIRPREQARDISDMNSLEIRLKEPVRREQVRDISDMNTLEIRLREQVRGKTFLFVLDDLWNESYDDWGRLRTLFTYGAKGSKVIVTTRSRRVASIVQNTIPIHDLEKLSDDDCWLLLAKHAFRNENSSAHPDLEEVGKKIAHKCNGLPLASKTLGGLLGCNLDYKEWNHILESNFWDLPHSNSVLPSLRLSYHYLPSYLKRCFAYCSIFPKGYELEKENVILLWVAEGLIPQSESGNTMEEVGERYFDELLSRSLFQRPRLDPPRFTMHDLINDLAMFVSGEFCFRLDLEHSQEAHKRVRHFSYMRGKFDTSSKFQPLDGVKYLHTFFPVSLAPYDKRDDQVYVSNKVQDDFLPAQKYLRVISLSRYQNINQLPNSIGNHIHLRYIDLSYTTIKKLPDTVCTLYNLQTLLLLGCSSLVKLPADMRKLIHLRHLDIGGTRIKKMPVHIGRLKSLRTLTAFVLGKSTGSSIGELRELSHLGGKISILNLQNVVGAIDALLKDKKDLNEVELAWGYDVSNDFVKKKHVLERLQPSVNLVKLTIRYYGGISFPSWVGDSSFSNLQVMRLSNCSNCSSLPPVGQLPALKELYVEGMKSVVSVGVELYGGNQPFQCLEKLEFTDMPEWEEWLPSPSGGESPDFPRLKELKLSKCPKLRGNLPTHLPSLKTLDVNWCEVLHESRASNTLNTEPLRVSLEELTLIYCPGLSLLLESTETLLSLQMLYIISVDIKWLPQMLPNSNRLQSLTLWRCSSLLSFPTNGLPTTLTSLRIQNCKKLEFLSREMMARLTSLQSLWIWESCDSLRSFPLGIFPKLSSLEIQDCQNLESLSVEGGADENLSHLNSLDIMGCRNLVSFPDGGLPTPNLTSLKVMRCENLKLLPDRMHTLTALQDFWIYGLPNVVSFAQWGLPPNLQSFGIVRASVEWGLQGLVSLRQFRIEGNKDLVETLLNEQLLPATLHTLQILFVSNLKSLDGKGLEHLTSLQHLEITCCESLKFLPKEGFPASLSYLKIRGCPSLKKRYLKKRYENIARIPCIDIDGEVNIL